MLYLSKVCALHFLRTRLLILQYVVFFVQLCQYFIYFLYTNRYFYHYFLPKSHTKDVSLCNLKRSKSDNVIIYFFTQSIPSFTIALFCATITYLIHLNIKKEDVRILIQISSCLHFPGIQAPPILLTLLI